ncbi:hypothetical protein LUZ63_000899 [Rhynchospora breviuscula]|uniref:DDT domain-containing protein n=1 Tax=Rhynchospora breviuscula TaxID=2022672 RepID=A0A9Q0CWD0_9POAL|nr:hypothetical protein LUZ63_000899 [Rhynchospora breviuscula]
MASLVSSSSPNPLLSSSQPDLSSMPSSSPRSPSPSSPPDPASNPNPSPSPVANPEPSPAGRRQRLPRACTTRSRAPAAEPPPRPPERRRREKTEEAESPGRVVTPLVADPIPADLPLFKLRSMWQLASVLNFLHVFRSLLNIAAEFTAEELELALIDPNDTLDGIHMPLLKSIPPVTRMAMGRGTWVTALCRKLRDWWDWVGEGEVPIVADHGAEIEAYKVLDPATRLVILKAICDIRVEQEDIRNYIDHSLKHGAQLSLFRKERIGGDAYGISYWYEDDPVLGHRMYREIRKVEIPKVEGKKPDTKKRKGRPPPPPPPIVTYQWETVATNLDEFQEVSDKLFASKNRTEVSLAKKLKIDYLPEIEKIHKMNIALMQKKEKLLKKQQREALLLNSYLTADGVTSGRSLRLRKNVTYTFDDYDRSINEAIKLTKKSQESPDPAVGTSTRRVMPRHEASANGMSNGQLSPPDDFHEPASPIFEDNYVETDREGEPDELLDRSNRQRKRPRRYSDDFVDAATYGADANFDSDDEIVGEAVYDDEYLKIRKNKSASSGSEGDEEYKLDDDEDEENPEEDEYDEEDYSIGSSEEELEMNHRSRRHKKDTGRPKRSARKLRSVDDIETGLRRSKRATRPKINYKKYEESESDTFSDDDADAAYSENDQELSTSTQDVNEEVGEEMEEGDDYDNNNNNVDNHNNHDNNDGDEVMNKEYIEMVEQEEQKQESVDKERSPGNEKDSLPRELLDLNDPAPDMGFDDGPDTSVKDEDFDDS